MKRTSSLITAMTIACTCLMAQTKEWVHPFTGFSNTQSLCIEKIVFNEKNTVVHAVARSAKKQSITISSTSTLSADGKQYPITKVSKVKMDKPYQMPDSGAVHFEMTFQPVPSHTRILHFIESPNDGGWKLYNIRDRKEDLHTGIPAEWAEVKYDNDPKLPKSEFCDDSTKISITILNYVPEAAKDLRLTFLMYDMGTIAYNKSYPLSATGETEIKLHPCFPSTVYMSLGDANPAPVIIEPGKDLSILMDMGNATNSFPAIGFKGNMAKTNYELNVKGGKNAISYRYDKEYYDSLLTSDANLSMTLSDEHFNAEKSFFNYGMFSPTTIEYLRLLNNYEFTRHCFFINQHINSEIQNILEKNSFSPNISRSITFSDHTMQILTYEKSILTSDHMTLCPSFYTVTLFRSGIQNNKFSDPEGRLHSYNKDIDNLYSTIAYSIANDTSMAARFQKQIKDSTLMAYSHTAAARWQQKVDMMNKTPHIRFSQGNPSRKEELRQSILNEHKGKTVVFIAFDKSNPYSAAAFERTCDIMKKCDSNRIAFICIDLDLEQNDYESWHNFATHHPGFFYMDTNQSYSTLFKFSPLDNNSPVKTGCQYEIYSPEGSNILSTRDDATANKMIKDIAW